MTETFIYTSIYLYWAPSDAGPCIVVHVYGMGCWHLLTLHVIVYRVYIYTLFLLIGVMNFRTLTELWHRSREANRKYRDVSVSRRLSTLRYLNSTALFSCTVYVNVWSHLLIILQYHPVGLQYTWLGVEEPIRFLPGNI